jgi:site-specific recombinase XerD
MNTLQRLIELFVDDTCAGKTNETPASYRRKLTTLVRWYGDRAPGDISPETLKQFKNHLLTCKTKRRGSVTVTGKLSLWTVRSTLVTVKHFCRWMYDHGYVDANPAAGFHVPQPPPPDPKPVADKTVTALIQAATQMGELWERPRNIAFLFCLRDTGGRISALLDAEVDGINLDAGEMATRSKGRSGTLYLSPPTVRAVRAWLEVRKDREPVCFNLFIGQYGRALSRSGAYWILRRLAKVAGGLDGRYNPHAWRHAFVRDVLRSHQADLSQASRLIWHTTIRTTSDYYARWDDGELREVHRRSSPGNKLPDLADLEGGNDE